MKIHVLYGSETGNAESLAEIAVEHLTKERLEATCVDMENVQVEDLPHFEILLLITSTWGDGEPPTNAYNLYEALSKKPAVDLSKVRFAVLALGDTVYPEFCKCGKDFDTWLGELGGQRLLERVDCDIDYDKPYETWMKNVIQAIKTQLVKP